MAELSQNVLISALLWLPQALEAQLKFLRKYMGSKPTPTQSADKNITTWADFITWAPQWALDVG